MTSVKDIQCAVADYYKLSIRDMWSKQRARSICWPRMIAMYLTREMTNLSYPQIGRAFVKDHTTVMNAVERIGHIIRLKPDVAYDIHRIRELMLGEKSLCHGRDHEKK